MTEEIFVRRINEVKQKKDEMEKKLNVRLSFKGNVITIDGSSIDEYEAARVFDVISFGFTVSKAMQLKEEEFIFRKIHIKQYTKRNLRDVKSRLIGTYGRTRKTVSEISGCDILIKEGDIGIIGDVEDVENAEIAVINLIRGSKQANIYKFLEKMNRLKK